MIHDLGLGNSSDVPWRGEQAAGDRRSGAFRCCLWVASARAERRWDRPVSRTRRSTETVVG